jgi:hypothetical protein
MTPSEKQTLEALWLDHTLCEVAKKMQRSKSWVHKWSNRIGLPAKPQSFRRSTDRKLEKGKQALVLRRLGWTWSDIAKNLSLAHRGHAHTLAAFAAEKEINNGQQRQ